MVCSVTDVIKCKLPGPSEAVRRNNDTSLCTAVVQEFIDIVETVYRGARKGRGLVSVVASQGSPSNRNVCGLLSTNMAYVYITACR